MGQVTNSIMRWFDSNHLTNDILRAEVEWYHTLALRLDAVLPPGAEKATALRKLLESKDAAVRSMIEKIEAAEGDVGTNVAWEDQRSFQALQDSADRATG